VGRVLSNDLKNQHLRLDIMSRFRDQLRRAIEVV
jgi:hypothetical protein